MERCLGFVPLDASVFDPEIGVAGLAPIGQFSGIEKLNGKVEPAHLAIFFDVPDQFVLQSHRIAFLQRARRIVRRRYGRKLYDIGRSVTKRYGAPIAELLIGFDSLVSLQFSQSKGSNHFQLVLKGQ